MRRQAAARRARVRVPEKAEQAHGVQLLRALGARVYVLGTVRRRGDHPGTMQTPGIPDVFAFLPKHEGRRRTLWWEVKAVDGRLRREQIAFQALCGESDLAHVVGPHDALIAWLVGLGYLKANQLPHYRQPKDTTHAEA